MQQKKFLAAGVALAIGAAAPVGALAASPGPSVSITIKSLTKTLLASTAVQGEKGSITKGGTPRGKCPGASAAGALDAATHGKWKGKYFSSVGTTFINSILGVKPPGKDYWELLVNGKVSGIGACSVKLKAGQKLLFKIVK